jgi:hypothetical protein
LGGEILNKIATILIVLGLVLIGFGLCANSNLIAVPAPLSDWIVSYPGFVSPYIMIIFGTILLQTKKK